jgi:hypothetical protein
MREALAGEVHVNRRPRSARSTDSRQSWTRKGRILAEVVEENLERKWALKLRSQVRLAADVTALRLDE